MASLDDWTADRAIPVAHLLRMAVDLLSHRRSDLEPVIEAKDVFERPIEDVSPLAALFRAPTVQLYLTGSTLAGFAERLHGLRKTSAVPSPMGAGYQTPPKERFPRPSRAPRAKARSNGEPKV